jgi:hypothetical protein
MTRSSSMAPTTRLGDSNAGGLSRLANVVLDPTVGFRDIDRHPTGSVAFVALVALRFGSLLAFYRPDTSPPRLLAGILFQFATLIPLVTLTTALLWIVAMLWRSRIAWASAWCITTHVMFAYTLLTVAFASVAGALLPESTEVDLRHPPFTNLGMLVSTSDSAALHALAVEADVRSAYASILAWLGVRAAANVTCIAAAAVISSCVVVEVLAAVLSALLR